MNDPEIGLPPLVALVSSYTRPTAALAPCLLALADASLPLSEEVVTLLSKLCQVDAQSVTNLALYLQQTSATSGDARVCVGLVCQLHGAGEILEKLRANPSLLAETLGTKELREAPCLGFCHAAPVLASPGGGLYRLHLEACSSARAATGMPEV